MVVAPMLRKQPPIDWHRNGVVLLVAVLTAFSSSLSGLISASASVTTGSRSTSSAAAGSDVATVLAWGQNLYGQLGDGTTVNSDMPEAIELASGVSPIAVSAGSGQLSAAAGSDGKLYVWGSIIGSGGYGLPFQSPTPQAISLPNGVAAIGVSAGNAHVLALGSDGKMYAWGSNYTGQLGDGTTVDRATPEAVSLPNGVRVTAISAGFDFSLALGADGKIYASGVNDSGQLGIGPPGSYASGPCSSFFVGCLLSPKPLTLPAGAGAMAISAGTTHSLALGTDGTVYAWGDDTYGELGDGTPPSCPCSDKYMPEAIPLPSGQRATVTSAGPFHSLAISTDGKIYAWGFDDGALGNGAPPPALCGSGGIRQSCAPTPTLINLPGGVGSTAVVAGDNTSFAIGSDGRIYAWGVNFYGELGDGTTVDHLTPEGISLPGGVHVDSVSAGNDDSLAIVDGPGVVPAFTAASPPLAAPVGATYVYTFAANGFPPPTYALATGAPSWLSINRITGALSGALPSGVTSFTFSVLATNVVGSATAGPFIVAVGSPATISGNVIVTDGAPVSGARVDACPSDGSLCGTGLTQSNGGFAVTVISGSTVMLTVYPPASLQATPAEVGPFDVPSAGLGGVTIALGTTATLPSGLQLGGTALSSTGLPIINWARWTPVTAAGCPDGVATVSVVAQQFGGGAGGSWDFNVYALNENPSGSGTYTGTIPPQYPLHGPAEITNSVSCNSAPLAGASALRLGTTGSAQLAAAVSAQQVLELIYQYAPKVLSYVYLTRDWKDVAKQKILGLKPTCQTERSQLEASLGFIFGPLVGAAADALTPLIEALIIGLFPESVVLAPILFALAPAAVLFMVSAFADSIIKTAVDFAFAGLGCLPANALIDPSGSVLDTNGNPIGGATTTILRSDSAAGPFAPVDASGPGIEPAVNPETTAADGVFQWDVASGFYEVQATAPGCTSPTDATHSTVTIGPYAVPPPRTGLAIVLLCANEAPAIRPAVSNLSVGVGPRSGGTAVTIDGSGFTPQSAIRFGESSATSVIYLSPTALIAVGPPGDGTVDVVVDTAGGSSATSSSDRFFYGSPPTVTNLSTTQGPTGGGNTIGISGNGFTGATSVSFSGIPATQFAVTSDSEISAIVPPGAAGTVDVQVANPAGGSLLGVSDHYTYLPATISATGTTISASEGAAFSGSVGSFTTPDPKTTATEYTAMIDWGDGTTNNGSISGPIGGPFNVAGNHTYTEEGTYTVEVKITNIDTPTNTATAISTAIVADAALAAGALSVTSGVENVTRTIASFSFTDANPSAPATDFTATIDWGDGTTSTLTLSGPPFTAYGSHTYTDEGTYTVKVSIADDGGSSASATGTARVADAPVAARCIAASVSPLSFSGSVASVTDQNPNGTAAEFTANIDWGDGSSSVSTAIRPSFSVAPTGGPFTVSGNHAYGSSGIFTITTTVSDEGGSTATTSCTVIVFATSNGGNFVIGDGRSAVGNHVTFWSAQWAKLNSPSGGPAPAAFKGFENTPSSAPACGMNWSTVPGDSSPPPTGPLPQFMAVIVAGSITQSGSLVTGNTLHVVVVETDPGYGPDPGHPGTGTIVAVIC